MDGPLAQSLGVEPLLPGNAVIDSPPRRRDDDIVTRALVLRALSSGGVIAFGTLGVFLFALDPQGDADSMGRALTMTFSTFIAFDMFNAYACRDAALTVADMRFTSNPAFMGALTFSVMSQFLLVYAPHLQSIFHTQALSWVDVLTVVAVSSSVLVVDTLRKMIFPSVFNDL